MTRQFIENCKKAAQSSGNVTEAAKLLGISKRTFYRKLDKYQIDSEQYRNR
ncbi:hypothetical protein LI177_04945 [bacterium 210820-DFI.6.37]|nr:hypothetical protein [bacterium 210820-DFI.6.37]